MTQNPEPRVRPTSIATLVLVVVVAAAAGWALFSQFYGVLPPVSLLPALTLVVLAVVEGITAVSTRSRVERRSGTQPVNPLTVARYVLVAKASSVAGALFMGGYLGILAWVWTHRGRLAAASDDVLPAALGAGAALLLLLAALWLERSCRIPRNPDDEDEPPPAR
jgi:hypothetical protein